MTGHVNLPSSSLRADPPGTRGSYRPSPTRRGHGLRRRSWASRRAGTWPARPGRPPTRGRRAQQLVRGLRAQPQPAVRGAGRHRPGWVRRRGCGAAGPQYLRLHLGQPDSGREDPDAVKALRASTAPASNPPFGTPTTTTTTTKTTTKTTTTTTTHDDHDNHVAVGGASGPVGLGLHGVSLATGRTATARRLQAGALYRG